MAERSTHYPTFVDGRYAHTSISQLKNFLQCGRIWYSDKFVGLKKPTTPAMQLGTDIHGAIEHYLRTAEVRNDEFQDYVRAAAEHLDPLVNAKPIYIESEFYLDTFPGGPKLVGYKDLEVRAFNGTTILDYKTTSDRKYAKTPLELEEDYQLNSYAKATFDENPLLDKITVGHLYLLTKNKKKLAWPVWAEVTRASTEVVWAKAIEIVKEMDSVVKALGLAGDRFEELTPNLNSCNLYGGCYFKRRCGIGVETVNFTVESLLRKKPKGDNMPSLSEKLAAKKNGKGPGEVPKEVYPVPTLGTEAYVAVQRQSLSIVPPDAPNRNEVPPDEAETPKPAKKVKKEKTLNLDEFKTPVAPTVEELNAQSKAQDLQFKAPSALGRKKFVLFIDCLPLKGAEYKDYQLFEDFIEPIAKEVAEQHGVADWRAIQYTARSAMAVAIRAKVNDLPNVLVINGFIGGSSEALEVLIPMATQVIKGIK